MKNDENSVKSIFTHQRFDRHKQQVNFLLTIGKIFNKKPKFLMNYTNLQVEKVHSLRNQSSKLEHL